MPVKRKPKVSRYELPRALQHHLRWVVTLAKLQELAHENEQLTPRDDSKKQKSVRRVAEIPNELIDAIMSRSPLTSDQFTRKEWDDWFAAQKKSPVNSIYECRAFYGLDSPNNIVQRFERALQDADGDERRGGRSGRSSYEEAITEWGEYAMALVRANGGHRRFFEITRLKDVTDVEPAMTVAEETSVWKARRHASESGSFIRRILSLQADQYIQILLPAVGVLWPLWFLRLETTLPALIATREERVLGPRLSTGAIPYIDLVTTIGQCAGLPYPFGVADKALRRHAAESGATFEPNAPWSTEAMTIVADAFSDERWSPPVLLAGRGDQWSIHEQPGRANQIVPIAVVAEASPIFGSMYVRDKIRWEKFSSSKVAYETKTWGAKLVQRLKLENAFSLSRSAFVEIRDRISDFDLILSYFPVDLLLKLPNVRRIMPAEIAGRIKIPIEDVEYVLPSTVLAAGALLGEQPKMRTLVLNFVRVLHRAVELVHHLRPRGDVLNIHLRALRSSEPGATPDTAAERIEQLCQAAASRGSLSAPQIHPDAIPSWMKAIGKDMVETLIPPGPTRADAIRTMKEWGWAQLLEYALTTSIYVSVELF